MGATTDEVLDLVYRGPSTVTGASLIDDSASELHDPTMCPAMCVGGEQYWRPMACDCGYAHEGEHHWSDTLSNTETVVLQDPAPMPILPA